jgi:diguanylate cyclase (GGDEF)-like protein
MFDISGKAVWFLLGYTLAIMSVMMAWCVATRPSAYAVEIELIYFVAMITVLAAISALSVQLSSMRNRLHKQRRDLEVALEQIRMVATHDELTGLPNRRQLLTLLGEHVARYARGGPSFSIALADLDHFKSVNDTFGHRVGDDALQCFSQQARLHLRSTDIAARWGGEEFLLLFPASPAGDPNIGIERLRSALAVAQASPLAPNLRIAFSTGLARYVSGESIDELIERADKALYEAKNGGRNQTRIAFVDPSARHQGADN